MLGAPGSGKGTQCERLVERYGVLHISTGDLYRAEVKRDTVVGRKLAEFMSRGELVPDEIGTTILRDRLEQNDAVECGWVGDGWTRERANSESLIRYRISPDVVINLVVARDVLVSRLSGRR